MTANTNQTREYIMSRNARLASLTGAFALLLLVQACSEKPADTAAADTAATMAMPAPAAPAELTARSEAMAASWNQDDPAVAAAFFADSATVTVDDSTYSGVAAIRDRWIAPGLPVLSDLTVTGQAFTGSGTSMTETGRFSEKITLPGKDPMTNSGSYTVDWTNVNGTWMINRFTVKGDQPMG